MFAGEEWVTVASSAVFVGLMIALLRRALVPATLWLVGAASFLVVAVGLAVLGLQVLEVSATPFIGALYPGFMAAGVLAAHLRVWTKYIAFIVVMLLLMGVGEALGVKPLMAAAEALLHGASGLIIIAVPAYYVAKRMSPASGLMVSLGGALISIGGLALAAIAAGKPILPLETVVYLLHPILFASALVMAVGLYASGGLGAGRGVS